jgi:integrase
MGAPTKPRPKTPRIIQRFTDTLIDTWRDFETRGTVWDSDIKGLRARLGVHRISFTFFQEHSIRGKRSTTCERLGFWPAMDVKAARRAALVIAGRNASGRIAPGKRSALKFGAALASYIDHLRKQAERRGKSPVWAQNVTSLAGKHLLPEFGVWSLAELSANPAAVEQWHREISQKSPVAANHAAKILRAVYKRAARIDRTLPPHNPTSAVEFNTETRSQKALKFSDFPKWFAAWQKIESPTRRAFQMINLLTGCRPGELSKLKWSDVLPRERVLVIRAAKAGNEIRVPMSTAVARELKRARDATTRSDSEWVFPARAGGHIVKFDDGLPAHGMSLRRVWRTVAADCGVDEPLASFLLGHIPAGISRGYVAKMILASGEGMRAAQRRVSCRIIELFRQP